MSQGYEEIAVLWHDGIGARITKRLNPSGIEQFSYQFIRRYEKGGAICETGWFSPRHIPAIIRLVEDVDERIKLERERRGALNA